MELVAGSRNAAELARVRRFLRNVTVRPVTPAISRRGYDLKGSYFLSHGLLIPDALIAATAVEHGLTLYTKNVRHFRMISALANLWC
jgi:predicted nucleic acid-binding protein